MTHARAGVPIRGHWLGPARAQAGSCPRSLPRRNRRRPQGRWSVHRRGSRPRSSRWCPTPAGRACDGERPVSNGGAGARARARPSSASYENERHSECSSITASATVPHAMQIQSPAASSLRMSWGVSATRSPAPPWNRCQPLASVFFCTHARLVRAHLRVAVAACQRPHQGLRPRHRRCCRRRCRHGCSSPSLRGPENAHGRPAPFPARTSKGPCERCAVLLQFLLRVFNRPLPAVVAP